MEEDGELAATTKRADSEVYDMEISGHAGLGAHWSHTERINHRKTLNRKKGNMGVCGGGRLGHVEADRAERPRDSIYLHLSASSMFVNVRQHTAHEGCLRRAWGHILGRITNHFCSLSVSL